MPRERRLGGLGVGEEYFDREHPRGLEDGVYVPR
jgi:hypothetical protein